MIFGVGVMLACVALLLVLRLDVLLLIAAICWIQNLVLPWLYTKGMLSVGEARALIVLKEALFALAFAYVALALTGRRLPSLPLPIRVCIAGIVYLCLRVALGVLVLGEDLTGELRLIRSFLLPYTGVLLGFGVTLLYPRFPEHYRRFLECGITLAAVVSLVIFLFARSSFWYDNVNIAAYNVEVKGDPEWSVDLVAGVSGTGLGRAVFSWLSDFRLIGTFGDPLTAGFVLATAILLIGARPKLGPAALLALAILGTAVLLTFSRSAWIFTTVGFAYIAYRERWVWRPIVAMTATALVFLALGSDLADFLSTTVASLEGVEGDTLHAEGLLRLYTGELLRLSNVLGAGPISDAAESATYENGFAYMLEQFGLGALVCFLLLCGTSVRYLHRPDAGGSTLPVVAAGCAAATLIASNFSFYALSFTPFYGIWVLIGATIGSCLLAALRVPDADPVPEPIVHALVPSPTA